jgi:hypothetical protein
MKERWLIMKTKTVVMAAAVILVGVCQAHATLVDSNSIVQDGIEYYMEIDRSLYNLGEDVEMLYRVTNLGGQDVTFDFPHSPEWNFWAEKDGQHVWRAVNGWWTFPTAFTLIPGESKEFPHTWDMRDDTGTLVNVGEYNVIGGLYAGTGEYDFTRVGVGIQIVPEPTSMVLFTIGLAGIMLNGKHRRTHICNVN